MAGADPNNITDSPVAGLMDPVEYAKIIRQQQMAEVLQQQALTPANVQQPASGVKGYYQAARISPFQAVTKVASALMARKALDASSQGQAKMMSQMLAQFQPGGTPQAPVAPGNQGDDTPDAPLSGYSGGGGSKDVSPRVAAAAATNPMNPQGLPAGPLMHLYLTQPDKYIEAIKGTPDWQNAVLANGGRTDLARQQMLVQAHKAAIIEARANNTSIDLSNGTSFTAPDPASGVQYSGDPLRGGLTAAPVPGVQPIKAGIAGATTAATEANTPRKFTTQDGKEYYATVPLNPNDKPGQAGVQSYFGQSSGSQQTTAGAQSQKTGAEESQKYAANVNADAEGALDVHRSLSELKNLAKSANPATVNNAKGQVGTMLMNMGIDPAQVSSFLGIDQGALQAANKQNAHLAQVSTKMVTSRGTNFDMANFMANNPNLAMTPGGFARVVEFMDKQAGDLLDKQKNFMDWKKNVPEDHWQDHSAVWNQVVRDRIDKGQTNSRRPLEEILPPNQVAH